MNKLKITAVSIITATLALTFSGCAFSKKTTITGSAVAGFSTNVTYTVNTNNLIIDCSILRGAASFGISSLIGNGHNNSLIEPLKDAQQGLDGILNGASTNNVNDVIVLLKAQKNDALTKQVTDLMTLVSSLEQKYLSALDANTFGYVSHQFTQAVYDGLTTALAGH